jgi:hypothetical protein
MFFERLFLGVVMACGLGVFGFILTAFLAGQFAAVNVEGVALAISVVLYGIGGALVGMVAGVILAVVVEVKDLSRVMLGTMILAALSVRFLSIFLMLAH